MSLKKSFCPDCDRSVELFEMVDRRRFLQTAGVAAASVASIPVWAQAKDASAAKSAPESVVKLLYESLSNQQKQQICFAWNYQDPKRGLLRTRVDNNWMVTDPIINSDFFTNDQRALVRAIFEGIIQPEWHERIYQQLSDDAGGFGEKQSIAIFGTPGEGAFEFVMTGRHMTLRCDGNSAEHVAFGGPIFYGHAAQGFREKADHPGNVFWPQAVAANGLYQMLDGTQREQALVIEGLPNEKKVYFRGNSTDLQGIPVTELSRDQQDHLREVLGKLIEPYRKSDQDEALTCLKAQGGLDACSMAFYQEKDIGNDSVWDNWRLEGPSFVWHFRGSPHVHVWVNVADDPSIKLNTGKV